MEWTELLFAGFLMLLGAFLLFLEIAVIPGFGLVGIAGGASLGGGILMIWLGLGTMWGVLALAVSIPVCVFVITWFLRSKLSNRLVLNHTNPGHSSDVPLLTHLVGRAGAALTTLRPAGTALIDNKRYDVVSEGEFIEKSSNIVVVRIDGNSVVVTKK